MAFKSATVNAASVPSTQTNFPSYVDLSRLGITTLAEAQSVRVYADSAKTTEWAREIVSATEMWVKVPSLTSTVAMYVDWDGVRADLAVTDTYGRNAVWSDYTVVWHMNDLTTSTVADSTGGGWTGTKSAANNPNEVAGIIAGSAQQFDDSGSDYIATAASSSLNRSSTNPFSIQIIFKPSALPSSSLNRLIAINSGINSGTVDKQWFIESTGKIAFQVFDGASRAIETATGFITTGNTYFLTATYTSGTNNLKAFVNATSIGTNTASSTFNHGANSRLQTVYSTFPSITTPIDEVRYRFSVLSPDWITTEYNNQSNESSFWGTWSTVGGGPVAQNGFLAWL